MGLTLAQLSGTATLRGVRRAVALGQAVAIGRRVGQDAG
jgi:hypothetical protein